MAVNNIEEHHARIKDKFTVHNETVKASLHAIGHYTLQSESPSLLVLGGIALQLHAIDAYPGLTRPTHDLDLDINTSLKKSEYRARIGEPLAARLNAYNPQVKTSDTYTVMLQDADGTPFFIHAPHYNTSGLYNRKRPAIERRLANASSIQIPAEWNSAENESGSSGAYRIRIARPEDIAADKTRRIIQSSAVMPENLNHDYHALLNRDWGALAGQELAEKLDSTINMKLSLPAYHDAGKSIYRNARMQYNVMKDLFDIALISKLMAGKTIEFDEFYYDSILHE